MLSLSLFFRLGCHRAPHLRFHQPSLLPLLAGLRRDRLLVHPLPLLPQLRRALILVRRLVQRRLPLGLPPPGSPPGSLSNWRRLGRRPLPGALVLLSPSLLPLGREGSRLGLPVLAPVPGPGWISHPLPPFPLARPLLRLLAGWLLLRRRAEVAQW